MYVMTDDPGVIDFASLTCPFEFLDYGFFLWIFRNLTLCPVDFSSFDLCPLHFLSF